MSEKNTLTSFYQNFSTETLESMLRDLTLSENELDMDQFDAIMAELDRREGAPETTPPEEALAQFRDVYSDSESGYLDCAYKEDKTRTSTCSYKITKRHRIILVAAIISIMLFGMSLMASASGNNVFSAIAVWSSERLGFNTLISQQRDEENAQDTSWPPASPEELGPPEEFDLGEEIVTQKYADLQDLLNKYSVVPEINAPSYIPEGFELQELSRYPTSGWMTFMAFYANESDEYFYIAYDGYCGEPQTTYEKTDDPVEIIEVNGITMYAFSNSSSEQIAWITDHFSANIAGDISREELVKIAQSIYLR